MTRHTEPRGQRSGLKADHSTTISALVWRVQNGGGERELLEIPRRYQRCAVVALPLFVYRPMNIDHILQLGEARFDVRKDEATLHALISNGTDFRLFWMISIPCEQAERVMEGGEVDLCQPRVYHESMVLPCRDWRDLSGVHSVLEADSNDPPGLYLGRHVDLDRSDIHFVARRGAQFDIDWQFAWSGLSGRVRTTVTLTHITVWLDEVKNEAAATKRLSRDLDLSSLERPEVVRHPSAGPRFQFRPIA